MEQSSHFLRITEIFHSLQGESTFVGLPTVFIRLTGCPLRCHYCDTTYAFQGGNRFTIDNIMETVMAYQCQYVCVTGGEPLAQPNCHILLSALCDQGINVSLETSGAFDLKAVDKRVCIVMDLKTPDSGECEKNRYSNLEYMKPTDQIKFVITNETDYLWARTIINQYQLDHLTQILFSPSYTQLDPTELANWILRDRLNVRFQLQLHKILWNDIPGH